jgi:3',5'-cyclic AMP phosphodiesterase CpdA
MSLSRRRFVVLGGLAVGAAGVGAAACRESDVQASAVVAGAQTAESAAAIGPSGFFAPERGDVRVALISDLNSSYGSVDYRREVAEGVSRLPEWQPDIVLCSGDMVAGQSLDLSASEIAAMWTAFDQQIAEPIRTAGLPFAITVGNHDASSYREGGDFIYVLDRQETAKYWAGHQSDSDLTFVEASGFPFYYSFKQNDIFYLVWDASSANVPPEQVAWADRALASAEAQGAKLRIVMGHLPMYAVAQRRDRAGEYLNQGDELRQLLERHQVHTYISGHHHAYFPGKVGEVNMLHAGALGSGPKSLLATNTAPFQTLTMMDIFLDTASTVYTTYNMNTLELVDPQALPRQIVGPTGRELRQDVALADLSPAEQAQRYVPSES